jgi:hypothetical protein
MSLDLHCPASFSSVTFGGGPPVSKAERLYVLLYEEAATDDGVSNLVDGHSGAPSLDP